MHLTLSLTHDCNLACSYCYAGHKRPEAMSRETAEAAIDLAFAEKPRSMVLGFFGGEPLLSWETLQHAVDYCLTACQKHSIPCSFTLTTNGSLLTDDIIDYLKRFDFHLGVSLDGTRTMHDICRRNSQGTSSFDLCCAGLDRAIASIPGCETIMVIDPTQCIMMAESVRFLAFEKNVRSIQLNFNYTGNWSADSLCLWRTKLDEVGDIFVEALTRGIPLRIKPIDNAIITRIKGSLTGEDFCSFGGDELAVAPSGRIYPCERLIGEDIDQTLCIGSVLYGLDETKRVRCIKSITRRPKECSRCAIRNLCHGRCGCVNYALTGDPRTPDEIVCATQQTIIAVADRIATILYRQNNPLFLSRFYRHAQFMPTAGS